MGVHKSKFSPDGLLMQFPRVKMGEESESIAKIDLRIRKSGQIVQFWEKRIFQAILSLVHFWGGFFFLDRQIKAKTLYFRIWKAKVVGPRLVCKPEPKNRKQVTSFEITAASNSLTCSTLLRLSIRYPTVLWK